MIFMGKPKFSRKKYETPSHPWMAERIKTEGDLERKYGLKNKREVWKAKTKLRGYRGQARDLSAKLRTGDPQSKKESDQLLVHLNRMNMLPPNSTLDDVLALNIENILSRRLQTLTYLKGFARTPEQSRQLISHGHIAIGSRRVTIPGYIVKKDEEGEISYTTDSPLNDQMHPARPRADFKSAPPKKEVKPTVTEKPKEEIPTPAPAKTPEPPVEEPTKEEVDTAKAPKDATSETDKIKEETKTESDSSKKEES